MMCKSKTAIISLDLEKDKKTKKRRGKSTTANPIYNKTEGGMNVTL